MQEERKNAVNKHCIITFQSISFAIKFEKILKENNIEVKLIPVPRKISSSCGLSGKIDYKEKNKIIEMCEKNKIQYENIYDF